MADVLSILSANYKTVGLTVPSKTPYFAVNPANYEGSRPENTRTTSVQDRGLERHGVSRQGALPERRYQQISGSADQG